MSFQTPVTVQDVLEGIHRKDYLLPAIQREFVWNADQVRRLVDSLMRGYPIGSFLFWKVGPQRARDYAFYDFLTDYHERDHPYATKAIVPQGQGVTAILDGQQRLTALNIAVYGTLAEKKKYAWWSSPDAFPQKRLYLNLANDPDAEELGLRFDLRFLSEPEAAPAPGDPDVWYPVGDILRLTDAGPAMMAELLRRGLDLNDVSSYNRLHALYRALRETRPINYYLETSQDADKVLDIFVRVNSGGTTLSYSDLLLSMATNQWETLDAREEVRKLLQEVNSGGTREFSFSKDLVLKTALMIAGVDMRFRVTNFTRDNMKKVEASWDDTRKALVRAASLIKSFGFSSRSLTADSVVIPVAYYLSRRGLGDRYLTSSADGPDRLALQRWVTRSLVKRGIWGSGLDTTLVRIRQAVDWDGADGFPAGIVEREMAVLGKSLVFDDTEIDELLELKYSGQRTFAVLSLLYPGLDLSKEVHEDHIFARSRFTPKRLQGAGVPAEDVEGYRAMVDLLPNLQLLPGVPNVEKQAQLPGSWLAAAFPTESKRLSYASENDLDGLPLDLLSFPAFFEGRKERMRRRLKAALSSEEG